MTIPASCWETPADYTKMGCLDDNLKSSSPRSKNNVTDSLESAKCATNRLQPRDDHDHNMDQNLDLGIASTKSEVVQSDIGTLTQEYSSSGSAQPWAYLVCFNSLGVLELINEEFSVGRNPSCDIVLNQSTISCTHFVIKRSKEFAILTDYSKNGTVVNGKKVKSVPLISQSEIFVPFDYHYVFLYPNDTLPVLNDRYYLFENKVLGAGSFAQVKLAVDTDTLERLACKILKIPKIECQNDRLAQEIRILSKIAHPNIVSIKDFCVKADGTEMYILMNRVQGGELFDRIVKCKGIPEPEALFLSYQLTKALGYLHDLGVCHRDLKAENVLLESYAPYSRLLLTDFGLSKSMSNLKTKCGTSTYLAPEVLTSVSGYDEKVDCWALGVLIYTLLKGNLPFGQDSDDELVDNICSANFSIEGPKWIAISDSAKDCISKLLVTDPGNRLSIQEVVEHRWIQSNVEILERLYQKLLSK